MKKILYILLLLSVVPCVAFSDGGGGVFLGKQQASYPMLEHLSVPNNSLGLSYYGGCGYGVSSDNTITGGFGVAVVPEDASTGIGGGFGGLVNGFRILRWPLTLQVVNYAGLGGFSTGAEAADFFGFFEELTVEVGIPLARWFMPTLFAGYQVIGRFASGNELFDVFSYTPVVGVKISWGDFY